MMTLQMTNERPEFDNMVQGGTGDNGKEEFLQAENDNIVSFCMAEEYFCRLISAIWCKNQKMTLAGDMLCTAKIELCKLKLMI